MTQLTASSGRKLALIAVGAAFFLAAGAAVAIVLDSNASLWSTLEQSSMYRTYSKQNPNEAARVKTYWLNGGAKPAVATKFGTFLVEVNEDRTPAPPPPPPPTDTTPTTPPPPPSTGFPDASTTGVPSGTALTAYTGPSNVTAANTLIANKTIGCITISAPGVVIRNSRITCGDGYAVFVSDKTSTQTLVTIEDSEISCSNGPGTAGVGEADFVVRRTEIQNCENGFDINQNALIEDNYVHNLYNGGSSHADGAQLASGHWNGSSFVCCALNVTFRHNTMFGMGNPNDSSFGTSAIISNPNGDMNVLIENNLLAGGAATLYCPRPGNQQATNYRVVNNRFSTRFKSTVGFYFPMDDCGDENATGNVYYETGLPVPLG